jgi:hypothetical protein
MSKLIPIDIKGEKLIQLHQLTIDQSNDLRSWLPAGSVSTVIYQGIALRDCIPFATYEYWYRTYHILSNTYETILDF